MELGGVYRRHCLAVAVQSALRLRCPRRVGLFPHVLGNGIAAAALAGKRTSDKIAKTALYAALPLSLAASVVTSAIYGINREYRFEVAVISITWLLTLARICRADFQLPMEAGGCDILTLHFAAPPTSPCTQPLANACPTRRRLEAEGRCQTVWTNSSPGSAAGRAQCRRHRLCSAALSRRHGPYGSGQPRRTDGAREE